MQPFYKNLIAKYKALTILTMSFMYTYIGIKHFINPQYFLNITPPQIPYKLFVVYFTGLLEILGGLLLLIPKTRKIGAYMIIFLLIIVFPANIYLYVSDIPQQLLGISKTQALIRMPFQIPLLLLAYWHSKENHPRRMAIFYCTIFLPTIIYFLF
tara:strand:+ start:2314 stop:2778 length:465 start_codon:yes stop_codon:yes gene_type:complete